VDFKAAVWVAENIQKRKKVLDRFFGRVRLTAEPAAWARLPRIVVAYG